MMMRYDAKVEEIYFYPKPLTSENPSTASLIWSNWKLLRSQHKSSRGSQACWGPRKAPGQTM